VQDRVEFALGQNLVLLRADGETVAPEFLRWLTTSPQWWGQIAKFMNVGAIFNSLRCADVPRFELPIPPLEDQRAVAATLTALDDKIELNRRMNETLEASARALFRDWFVDFGPTRAKAEHRPPYLAPDLWSLFPDQMGNDGVPLGWEWAALASIAELNPESWSARNRPPTLTYVDLSNTKWGYIEAVEMYSFDDAPSRARRVLRPGDTIVGTVRPGNGSFAYISEPGLTGSTGFAVLRPKDRLDQALVWCAATDPSNIERLTHLADGGAYPAVRPDIVANTEIALPDTALRVAFAEATSPVLNQIEANKRQSRTLAETRDALLPKLMSGEIRVRDAEALVAECV
jgi:type I restriction enzyme S subunit